MLLIRHFFYKILAILLLLYIELYFTFVAVIDELWSHFSLRMRLWLSIYSRQKYENLVDISASYIQMSDDLLYRWRNDNEGTDL